MIICKEYNVLVYDMVLEKIESISNSSDLEQGQFYCCQYLKRIIILKTEIRLITEVKK